MKKFLSLLILLTITISFSACSANTPKEKTFSSSGMEITLTSEFTQKSMANYTVCYESPNSAVLVLKESFSLMDGSEDMTLAEYGEMVRNSNSSHSPSSLSTANGITYFEYSYLNQSENITYRYYTTVHKGSDAFWLIQFVCPDSQYTTQKTNFVTFAKSISIS